MTRWKWIIIAVGATLLTGGLLLELRPRLALLTGFLTGILAGYLPRQGVKAGLWHGCVAAAILLALGGVVIGALYLREQTGGLVSTDVAETIYVELMILGLLTTECLVASGIGGLLSKYPPR